MASLSVQLYSVRDALAADPSAALARLAGIGFEEVELFDLVRWGPALEAPLADLGLVSAVAHASIVGLDDPEPVFAAARSLGVTTVIEPTVRDGWTDAAGVERIAQRLNALAGAAAEHGLTIGYHNHWWEFGEIGRRTALEHLDEHLEPSVVLEFDAYWAAVAGMDIAPLAARLAGRIRHLHVKDGPVEPDPSTQVAAGSGAADLTGVLAAVPDATRVLEFDRSDAEVFADLAAGVRWVRAQEVGR
ncbi:sugar phosphate isomerase/epimerase [Agromyces sp. LHK192]|uniref:sugar phosphate isomerase/epimerase family protein n=1 Tax=Agromyces sp. LHK192 TaxID=2498704 RepID=UPI000FDA22EC|nr:sugar phosphate isomerase/epimerase [Agromyces sp. LHK192]